MNLSGSSDNSSIFRMEVASEVSKGKRTDKFLKSLETKMTLLISKEFEFPEN